MNPDGNNRGPSHQLSTQHSNKDTTALRTQRYDEEDEDGVARTEPLGTTRQRQLTGAEGEGDITGGGAYYRADSSWRNS